MRYLGLVDRVFRCCCTNAIMIGISQNFSHSDSRRNKNYVFHALKDVYFDSAKSRPWASEGGGLEGLSSYWILEISGKKVFLVSSGKKTDFTKFDPLEKPLVPPPGKILPTPMMASIRQRGRACAKLDIRHTGNPSTNYICWFSRDNRSKLLFKTGDLAVV